jgi:O-antigen/teichoic acid export membrane protein
MQFFGPVSAGVYALSVRLLEAPMRLVTTPLRPVLLQRISERANERGELRSVHRRATLALLGLALGPVAVLFVLCPTLFAWFLGEEWRAAGVYGRWLLLWLLPAFCNTPSTVTAWVMRRQRGMLIFDALSLAARTLALCVGGCFLSDVGTVALFSAVGGVMNVGLIAWVWTRVAPGTSAGPGARHGRGA